MVTWHFCFWYGSKFNWSLQVVGCCFQNIKVKRSFHSKLFYVSAVAVYSFIWWHSFQFDIFKGKRHENCSNVLLRLCGVKLMYRSIPKPPMPPPPGQTPGHLTFLKKFGQIPRYVRRSNAPPVRDLGMWSKLWKQVLQNFQLLRVSCSACLRSTLKQRHIPR